MKHVAGVLLALCVLASARSAQLADFDARRSAAYAVLAGDLEEYAEWCKGKRLFVERKRAFDLLLTLVPEHEDARRTLGYVKEKDGSWKAPAEPKEFHDYDSKALKEAPARFVQARADFVAALSALLEDPALSPEQRALVEEDVLRFDPDNALVHRLRGEVQDGERWVIPETLRAKERRAELREIVRVGLEKAPRAEPSALTEREKALQLPLRAFATPRARVVGSGSDEELLLMAQALHGIEHVLQSVLQTRVGLPAGCTVFLLADPAQKPTFLANHPALNDQRRALLQQLDGSGIQGTADFAFWAGDMQRRIDGSVRLVLGYCMTDAFGLTVDQGWAYEGFGLFLTRALVRTRLTWFAQPARLLGREKEFALRQRLHDPETNWVDEAYLVLQAEQKPPLADLLVKGVNDLTIEDLLYANVLATYLCEAQPDKVGAILKESCCGKPAARVLERELGLDLPAFEAHLARWLSERK